MDEEAVSRDHVGSLERGLAVMEILARHPSGMTLTEMAEEAGLTRAGARRFLLTLVATGYATQDGRSFSLSPRLLTVARTWLGGGSLWSFAAPIMRAVAAQLNEACSAAILSGQDVVYVARIPGRRILSVSLDVGTRLPAYCTSMGRILLAGLTPEDLDTFLQPGGDRETDAEDDHRHQAAGRRHRQGQGGRFCHRRRGTGTRPALHRRADPRPLRKHGRGHQRLDAVGAIFGRGDGAGNPAGAA